MKNLRRNTKVVYYCLYEGKEAILDENGLDTGEKKLKYSEPFPMRCSNSSATGQAQLHMFGVLEQYDRVLITDEMNHPIDKDTVFFIDKDPEFIDGKPVYDYIIKRVSKSLNYLSLVVKKTS